MSLTTRIVRKHFVRQPDGSFRHECNDWDPYKSWKQIIEENAKWAFLAGVEVLRNKMVAFHPFKDEPVLEFCVELEFKTRRGEVRLIRSVMVQEDEYRSF